MKKEERKKYVDPDKIKVASDGLLMISLAFDHGRLTFQVEEWVEGKEKNVRALLSTLQNVLWPEADWTPLAFPDVNQCIRGDSMTAYRQPQTEEGLPERVQAGSS